MAEFYTEQEIDQISKVSTLAWRMQRAINWGGHDPPEPTFIFIAEHSWMEPFIIEDVGSSLAISPTHTYYGPPDVIHPWQLN